MNETKTAPNLKLLKLYAILHHDCIYEIFTRSRVELILGKYFRDLDIIELNKTIQLFKLIVNIRNNLKQ